MNQKISPIYYKKLIKIFELDGFAVVRQEGDHIVLTKSGIKRPLVIPTYSDIPVFIIKNNMRSAGMSRERYFELLNQV